MCVLLAQNLSIIHVSLKTKFTRGRPSQPQRITFAASHTSHRINALQTSLRLQSPLHHHKVNVYSIACYAHSINQSFSSLAQFVLKKSSTRKEFSLLRDNPDLYLNLVRLLDRRFVGSMPNHFAGGNVQFGFAPLHVSTRKRENNVCLVFAHRRLLRVYSNLLRAIANSISLRRCKIFSRSLELLEKRSPSGMSSRL